MTASNATPTDFSGEFVTLDRRRQERRAGNQEAIDDGAVPTPRRKKQRRRHIDPTTCERDYSDAEIEFMRAMDDYKQSSGRMFPTCSEVLEVLRGLGYFRLTDEQVEQLGLIDDEPLAEVGEAEGESTPGSDEANEF